MADGSEESARTVMELATWMDDVWGRQINYPGGLGGECVDLCNDYLDRVWVHNPVRADAQQWPMANISGSTYVRNTPDNAPPQGAIVCWRGPIGSLGLTDAGHVAIALTAGKMRLWTVDQNWAGQRYAALHKHTYPGVHGWWLPPAP